MKPRTASDPLRLPATNGPENDQRRADFGIFRSEQDRRAVFQLLQRRALERRQRSAQLQEQRKETF